MKIGERMQGEAMAKTGGGGAGAGFGGLGR